MSEDGRNYANPHQRDVVRALHEPARMRMIVAGVIALSAATAAAEPAGHPEYSVRAGMHSTELVYSDDAPAGSGPTFEVGAAWRFKDWLSLGAFGAFSRLRDSFGDPFDANKMYSSTVQFFDVGARITFHAGGAFAGLGLGIEKMKDNDYWDGGSIGELHAGYRFPRVSWIHGAPELMGMIGRASTKYDGDFVLTARLSLGVVF